MNIEIANRLVNLRKSNSLSQEALAEKLGISRQAVSKWERAEASPDTDNLILLARLYHISLDELLKTEDEIPMPEDGKPAAEFGDTILETDPAEAGQEAEPVYPDTEKTESARGPLSEKSDKKEYVYGEWDGIDVGEAAEEEYVYTDEIDAYVNGEKHGGGPSLLYCFPIPILISIVYLLIGFMFRAWHPGWLLFLLIPIWYSMVTAIVSRNALCFAYPVFITLIYLCLGTFWNLWHPGWIIFLTIPLYYSFAQWINSVIESCGKRNGGADER